MHRLRRGALIAAQGLLLEAQSFQTQFSSLSCDRSPSPQTFHDIARIEVSTGGQDIRIPLGPGIGSRDLHYTPALRGHFRPTGGIALHARQAMSEFECRPEYPAPSSLSFPYRRLVDWHEYAYADFVQGFDLSPGVLQLPLAGPVAPFYERRIFWYTDEFGCWPFIQDLPGGRCSHYQVIDGYRRAIRQMFRHQGHAEAGLVSCTTPAGESLIQSRLASLSPNPGEIRVILDVFGFPAPWALAEPDDTPNVRFWNLHPSATTDGALVIPMVHSALAPFLQVDAYNGCTPQDEESRPGSGAANDAAFPQYRLPSAYLVVQGDVAFLYLYARTDYGLEPTYVHPRSELEGRNARFAEYRIASMRNRTQGMERIDWEGFRAKYVYAGSFTGAEVTVEPGRVAYATGTAAPAPSFSIEGKGGMYGGDFWQCPDTGSFAVMSPYEKHHWMFNADGTNDPHRIGAHDALQSLLVDSVKDDASGLWLRFNAQTTNLSSRATVSYTTSQGSPYTTSADLHGVITSIDFGSDAGGITRQIRFGFEKYPFQDDAPLALGSKPMHDVAMNTPNPNAQFLPKYALGVHRVEDQDMLASGPAATRVTTYEREVPQPGLLTGDPFTFLSSTFKVKVNHPDGSWAVHAFAEPNGSPKSLQYLCYLKHLETRRELFTPSGTCFEVELKDRPSLASSMNLSGAIGTQTSVPHFTRTRTWNAGTRVLHTRQAADFHADPSVAGYGTAWEAWSQAGSPPLDHEWEEGPRSTDRSCPLLDAFPPPNGHRVVREDIQSETLPGIWVLNRSWKTTQALVQESTGNLEPGKDASLPATIVQRVIRHDSGAPALNRMLSERVSRGSGGSTISFAYAADTGPLALRPIRVTVGNDLPEVTSRPGAMGVEYTYDPLLGYLERIHPLGVGWSIGETRDPLQRIVGQSDANGLETTFAWDASGRLVSSIPAGERGTRFTPDPDGRGGVVLRNGTQASFRINAFGDVTLERRHGGSGASHRAFGHDPAGRCIWRTPWLAGEGSEGAWSQGTPPVTAAWRQAFDGLGRVIRRIDPNGAVVSFGYAPYWDGGLVLTRTNAAGTTTLTRDADGCLASVSDPLGLSTRYTYDPSGRLRKVVQTDPLTRISQTRIWTFNDLGWATGHDQPETGLTTFKDFDPLGNPWTVDASGRKRKRQFDTLGRLKREVSEDGTLDDRYLHDGEESGHGLGNGRLIRTRSTQGIQRSWTFERNATTNPGGKLSRLDTQVDDQTFSQSFSYDASGRMTARRYPDGSIQTITYDETLGLPSEITFRGASVASFAYHPDSWALKAIAFHGGAARSTFDRRPDQVSLSGLKHELAIPFSGWPRVFTYAYDACGRMTSDGEDHFAYDPVDRLTRAYLRNPFDPNPDGGICQIFWFDAFGNRTMADTLGITRWKAGTEPPAIWTSLGTTALLPAGLMAGSYVFKDADPAFRLNRLPALTSNGALTNAVYDDQGNLTHVNLLPGNPKHSLDLGYDALGRITRVESQDGTGSRAESYALDAQGLRTRVTDSAGRSVIRIHDEESRLIACYEGAAKTPMAWKRCLVYGGGQLLAEANPKSPVNLFLSDHLGTPRWTWDTSAKPPVPQKFLPFGEQLADPDAAARFPMGFTNHEQTDPSGLICMRSRYYLPTYGRFASPDGGLDQHLGEPQSWNSYAYVQNNPMLNFDPNGKWRTGIHNRIISMAFHGRYTEHEIRIIQAASKDFDLGKGVIGQKYPGSQSMANSPWHSMSPAGGDPVEARKERDAFVEGIIRDAAELRFAAESATGNEKRIWKVKPFNCSESHSIRLQMRQAQPTKASKHGTGWSI